MFYEEAFTLRNVELTLFRFGNFILALLWPGLASVSTLYRAEARQTLGLFTVACVSQLAGGALLLAWHKATGGRISVPASERMCLLKFTLIRCVLGELLFIFGLGMSSGLNAVFLSRTEPFLVLLWGYILSGICITAGQFILMLCGFAAAVIFSGGGGPGLAAFQSGDAFIFLALMVFSLTYSPGARLSKSVGALNSIVLSQIMGGLILLPPVIWEVVNSGWTVSSTGMFNLLFSTLLYNVFAVSIWLAALEKLPPWLVSALGAIGPMCASPVAWLVFDKTLTATQLFAGGIVVLSSALLALSARRDKPSGIDPAKIVIHK